jgi:hypothetical protein
MKITIFMPVSRDQYLDTIFARLEMLDCNKEETNLLVIVDGDEKLFVKARNFVEMSKFNERLCIQFKSNHKIKQFDTLNRRRRIADVHNLSKDYINDCEFIFGIEDDTIFPLNTLTRLIKDYSIYPHAGFIQGVQLGRWGIAHVGAWKVDDIYNIKLIESISVGSNLKEIDAGGFYCYLTRKKEYLAHNYDVFDNNILGPDFNYGVELRQIGFINYIDWSIQTTHKTKKGDITLLNSEVRIAVFRKNGSKWIRSNHI